MARGGCSSDSAGAACSSRPAAPPLRPCHRHLPVKDLASTSTAATASSCLIPIRSINVLAAGYPDADRLVGAWLAVSARIDHAVALLAKLRRRRSSSTTASASSSTAAVIRIQTCCSHGSSPRPAALLALAAASRTIASAPPLSSASCSTRSTASTWRRWLECVQEDLKKSKDQLAFTLGERDRLVGELNEATRVADETNEKLQDALMAKRWPEEATKIEKFRADELEQAGIDESQRQRSGAERARRMRGWSSSSSTRRAAGCVTRACRRRARRRPWRRWSPAGGKRRRRAE